MEKIFEELKKNYGLNDEDLNEIIERYKSFLDKRKEMDVDDMEFTIEEICDIIDFPEIYGDEASKYADDEIYYGTKEWLDETFPGKYLPIDDDECEEEDWRDIIHECATELNLRYDIHGCLIVPDEYIDEDDDEDEDEDDEEE